MANVVLGVFTDSKEADKAVNELRDLGYKAKDISIITKQGGRYVGGFVGTSAAEGAVGGITTGGILGGVTGLLIGIGAITIPGIGGLLVGGPIAAALGLSGAAATTFTGVVTGVVAGGLVGALVGLGIPEEDARVYEERIKQGAMLIAVPTRGNDEEVREVLENRRADQIRSLEARF